MCYFRVDQFGVQWGDRWRFAGGRQLRGLGDRPAQVGHLQHQGFDVVCIQQKLLRAFIGNPLLSPNDIQITKNNIKYYNNKIRILLNHHYITNIIINKY